MELFMWHCAAAAVVLYWQWDTIQPEAKRVLRWAWKGGLFVAAFVMILRSGGAGGTKGPEGAGSPETRQWP